MANTDASPSRQPIVPSPAAAALKMAHDMAVLARRALAAAAAEAAEAAHAAAAQLASERLVWEAELGRQQLKLTIEQELSMLMDDREKRGLQRFVVRARSLWRSGWLALCVCGRHCRRSCQRCVVAPRADQRASGLHHSQAPAAWHTRRTNQQACRSPCVYLPSCSPHKTTGACCSGTG